MTRVAAPTPAVPSTERYDTLDVARGLAVLVMLGAHLAGTDGGVTAFERALTGFLAALEPTVGALFCVVAGVSWAIQADRVGATSAFRRYLAGRALALGVFGVLFHGLFWTSEILVPFAMMMALSAVVLGRGPRVAAAGALLFVAATPVVTRLLGDHAVTDWTDDGLHAADRAFGWVTVRYLLFDGNYPLFSWMAFPLIGIAFWQTAGTRARRRAWCLGALGAAVVAYAVAARRAPDVAGVHDAARYLARGWTPSSATFLLTAGSGSLAFLAGLLWRHGTAPMPRGMRPLVLFGRASLSHYVLHIAVAYSALRLWYPAEDWPVTIGFRAMLAYLAVGVPLTVAWFRRHTHGPLETLWARTSRRPAPRSAAGDRAAPYAVEVRRAAGGAGVYARRPFAPGEVVLPIEGRVAAEPARYAIQVAPDEHLVPSSESASPWAFLNHGCAPNVPNVAVDVAARAVVARRAVAAGDELRFDYNTTAWDMAEPFACACGAPDCIGTVRGFRHLPPDRQRALLAEASPHVRALHASAERPGAAAPPASAAPGARTGAAT